LPLVCWWRIIPASLLCLASSGPTRGGQTGLRSRGDDMESALRV
jgi:hypothetical protein